MKKSEIAVKVFDTLNALPLADVAGGPLAAPVADLAAVALVPWFCDASIQWALRLTMPGSPLKKTLLKLQLLPRWLTSADFRIAFTSGVSANSECFERELLDHYRLVFEKTR